MGTMTHDHWNIAQLALVVSIVSASVSYRSSRLALSANRISILPVLTLFISDETKNTQVRINNIGQGIAHDIKIPPAHIFLDRRTPMRRHERIVFTIASHNFIKVDGDVEVQHDGGLLAWYLRVTKEGYADIPVTYSDSIGTRYITIFRTGYERLDILLTPRKYGLLRKIMYFGKFKIYTFIYCLYFKFLPNDKRLKRE